MSFLFIMLQCAMGLSYAQTRVNNIHENGSFKFKFGEGNTASGYISVTPETVYSPRTGYGIDLGSTVTSNKTALNSSYITSDKPFYFSVRVPEGNYRVKVTLGDDTGTVDMTIRAECRRLMVNRVKTLKGEHKTVEFTVNIRDSLIKGLSGTVNLKPREHSYLHWDNKLTLEFNGNQPKINAIDIEPEKSELVTVFLAGNSTVVDQASEPYASWGQMIPASFEAGKVAIANYAESGETLSSFIASRRFAKILSLMKPGDYVFVEFGHNDQKQKGPGVGAFTTYKQSLMYFIAEVKKKRGNIVLVTSVQRRKFDGEGRIIETLGDYPSAVRQIAKEENLPLIDLNAMTKTMYEAWGPDKSVNAFVHFPANTFPGQSQALEDNTHFRPFGAFEVSKLVIKGIRDCNLGLAKFLKNGVPVADPAKPGALEDFYWPVSLPASSVKPDGN